MHSLRRSSTPIPAAAERPERRRDGPIYVSVVLSFSFQADFGTMRNTAVLMLLTISKRQNGRINGKTVLIMPLFVWRHKQQVPTFWPKRTWIQSDSIRWKRCVHTMPQQETEQCIQDKTVRLETCNKWNNFSFISAPFYISWIWNLCYFLLLTSIYFSPILPVSLFYRVHIIVLLPVLTFCLSDSKQTNQLLY